MWSGTHCGIPVGRDSAFEEATACPQPTMGNATVSATRASKDLRLIFTLFVQRGEGDPSERNACACFGNFVRCSFSNGEIARLHGVDQLGNEPV